MDNLPEVVSHSLTHAKAVISDSLTQIRSQLHERIPQLEDSIGEYIHAVTSTSKDELFEDIYQLKVTPATTTLLFTTLSAILLASGVLLKKDAATEKKTKPKKKKLTKAQIANREIQAILDHVEDVYVPQIDEYIDNYKTLSEQDQQYKYNFFEEMLLKALMKLDGVDIAGNEVLRDNRKKVIKFIQDHQKRLDNFKKQST